MSEENLKIEALKAKVEELESEIGDLKEKKRRDDKEIHRLTISCYALDAALNAMKDSMVEGSL